MIAALSVTKESFRALIVPKDSFMTG